MSIFIEQEKMPKGCGVCPLFDDECFGSYKCKRAKGWGDEENRAYDCPLKEIKTPHDNLVDISEVKEKMLKYGFKAPDMTVSEFIESELTTIIEKEK